MGVNSLKHLVSAFLFASLLFGCGGGSSSTGVALNLDGIWRLYPQGVASKLFYLPATAVLKQTGNKVVSTSFTQDAGIYACSPGTPSLAGTVSGNTVTGTVTASNWTATFSVSGNSSSLSGTFEMNHHSGYCSYAGTETGTITLSKF